MSKRHSRKPTNSSIKNENIQLKRALDEAKCQIKDLVGNITSLKDLVENKSFQISDLEVRNNSLLSTINKITRENIRLNDELYSINMKYKDGISSVLRAEENSRRMNVEFARLSKEISKVRELANDGI